ncbi:MAG: hypothetical protein IMY73_05040 [Bacteroidetes bacterium]|nr:hypothetical protein [Bacteroidota bacterium]
MSKYTLKKVENKKDIRIFLDMPMSIYRNDSMWVRPLDNDIENVFSPQKNELFEGGEAIRWIAFDGDKPVGRIAAFYNMEKAKVSEQLTGGCGFFECIDNQEVANILFDASVEWLEKRGMKAMDGSINFGDREQFWGVLIEGYDHPMYGMNYNLPYYGKLFENYGFQNYFNQYSHRRVTKKGLFNKSVYARVQRLSENPDYEFRPITRKEIKGVGQKFRSIYNKAWANFTGVKLMTEEQAEQFEKTLKPIINPDLIYFAYYKGEAIGFFIMLPDLNCMIKDFNGKLGIMQKLKLFYRLRVKKSYDKIQAIVFGVMPEFQGKGIESGLMMCSENTIADKINVEYIELVWVGDFNPLMLRMVENYVCAERCKQHTTFRYMIDKSIEFKRAPRVSVTRKPIK